MQSNLPCNNQVVAGYKTFLQKVEISSTFCNKIFTCCTNWALKQTFFAASWHKSRIWRESRAILSNQKSVFRQLATTWFDTRQVWTWVVNKATSLFNNFFSAMLQGKLYVFFFRFPVASEINLFPVAFPLKNGKSPRDEVVQRFESKSHTTGLLRNLLRKCMARHHGLALLCCCLFVAKFESFCF